VTPRARWTPYLLVGVLTLGAGLGLGLGLGFAPSGTPMVIPRLSQELVEAFNGNYHQQHPKVAIRLVTTRPTPTSEQQAVSLVSQTCGGGSRIIAVGMVKASFDSGVEWAVFFDPPGKHFAVSGSRTASASPLNWYAGFVSAIRANQPFCTSGYYGGLPRLPVFSTSSE
jgi:hypothetical protein